MVLLDSATLLSSYVDFTVNKMFTRLNLITCEGFYYSIEKVRESQAYGLYSLT